MPPTPRGRPLLLLLPRARSAPPPPPPPPPSPAAGTRRCPSLSTTSCTRTPAGAGPSPPRRPPASVRPGTDGPDRSEARRGAGRRSSRHAHARRRGREGAGRPDEALALAASGFVSVAFSNLSFGRSNNYFVMGMPN